MFAGGGCTDGVGAWAPVSNCGGCGVGCVSGVDGESVDVGIDEVEALAWLQPCKQMQSFR